MRSDTIARMKAIARYLRAFTLYAIGVLWIVKRRTRTRGEIVVLTFHRILDDWEFDRSSSLRGTRVRARTFEAFTDWVSQSFEVVRVNAVGCGRAPLRRARLALTFDDGWLDTYIHAYPIAAKHGLPLTVFVCTGLVGEQFPFWPERVCRTLRMQSAHSVQSTTTIDYEEAVIESMKCLDPRDREAAIATLAEGPPGPAGSCEEPLNALMNWDQIRALHAGGIAIGSHTATHPILTRVPAAAAETEMVTSKVSIECELDDECSSFAYPNGNVNPNVRAATARSGYRLAFTMQRGYWSPRTDPLLIPRINIWEQKLVGPRGRFSRVMAMYSLFWTPRH